MAVFLKQGLCLPENLETIPDSADISEKLSPPQIALDRTWGQIQLYSKKDPPPCDLSGGYVCFE